MPRLDIYQKGALLLQVQVRDEALWIGRGKDCQISLNDLEISRKHAMIAKHGDAWEIQSQGRNGTRLNTELVEGTKGLNFGDRIYLGNHALVFESDDAPVLKQNVNVNLNATTKVIKAVSKNMSGNQQS